MWRGNQLLGELRVHSLQCEPTGTPSAFTALLVSAPDSPSCEPVFQAVTAGLVVQHRMKPDGPLQSRPIADASDGSVGDFELQPVPPEDLLPPEKQLTIRDAAGKVYLPAVLIFDECVIAAFANGADGPGYAIAPPVTIGAIVEGIQMQSDEVDSYLHRVTARVVAVNRDALEAADEADNGSNSSQELRLARAILQSKGEYLALPSRFDLDENCVMKQLADADERYLQAALEWCAANHVRVA
jgi:hypothetical protein